MPLKQQKMRNVNLDHLIQAAKLLTEKQGHPQLNSGQIFQLECMVNKENSLCQHPTGSGKTYAGICLPDMLLILRDKFGYQDISDRPRVLYIVPLVAIMRSLEEQLVLLDISYQFLKAGTTNLLNDKVKVVAISPEKLTNPDTLTMILNLEWEAIVLDEPHLAVQWGIGNKKRGKFTKPFREAFAKIKKLNQTGAVFQLQTATAVNLPQIFALLGRKDSCWKKNVLLPNRKNLVYYLFTGKGAPQNIMQFDCIKEFLNINTVTPGALLIYVQRVDDGSNIYSEINEFCTVTGISSGTGKRFAFLHASLEDGSKNAIMRSVAEGITKVLIATSALGNGVNLPFRKTIMWGLDPEPAGIVQASGRTARHPYEGEGSVIMVRNIPYIIMDS